MDTIATINKKWRLSTLLSSMGCIILILCLNHGQDKYFNLSALKVALSLSLPSSSSSNSNLRGEVLGNHRNGADITCNIFDGKWVYDPKRSPLYNVQQCPFLSGQVSCQRNGRPDTEYEKWRWEGKGCDIPRFNGTNMLERLRGKRLIIVGDSLNRNQFESLACLLYSALPASHALVAVQSSNKKIFRSQDYNCSVEFYWSPFLVQLEEMPNNGSRILRLDKLSLSAQEWKGADIMVFNTGHWWVHRGKLQTWDFFEYNGKLMEEMEIESALEIAISTWANWIDNSIDMNKTAVFFRSISPEHKGKHKCHNKMQPIMDESFVYKLRKPIKEIIERTIRGMKTPVRYLNITKLSEYREDAHPAFYARKELSNHQFQAPTHPDCSHWCLPGVPDTWNSLLYASMVLESSKKNFRSPLLPV